MKKLLSFVVLGLVGAAVLMGCKKAEEPMPSHAPMPSTNAPAAP